MAEDNAASQPPAGPITAPVAALTLNPALDITVSVESWQKGAVNRAQAERMTAGGKGLNVAATLASGGFKTAVTGILGQENSAFFKKFFAERGMEDRFLYIPGATRNNIKLISAAETTDINLPGLPAAAAQLEELRALLAAAKSRCLVLSGSVPPHCPPSFYADFLQFYAAQPGAHKAKCVVDCSGAPLKALLSGPARPFCIKPNKEELAEWTGRPAASQAEILAQARALAQTGIALAIVSMGGEGALFVAGDSAYFAKITLDKVESTVGAGDAMVAGIVAALLRRPEQEANISDAALAEIAKTATLWAAGKLQCAGPALPPPARMAELEQKLRCEKLD